jgi:hypothetical protein
VHSSGCANGVIDDALEIFPGRKSIGHPPFFNPPQRPGNYWPFNEATPDECAAADGKARR